MYIIFHTLHNMLVLMISKYLTGNGSKEEGTPGEGNNTRTRTKTGMIPTGADGGVGSGLAGERRMSAIGNLEKEGSR